MNEESSLNKSPLLYGAFLFILNVWRKFQVFKRALHFARAEIIFEARLLESCVGGVAAAMALASSCFRNVGWLFWGVVLISFLSYGPALESIPREQFFLLQVTFFGCWEALWNLVRSRLEGLFGILWEVLERPWAVAWLASSLQGSALGKSKKFGVAC